MLEPKKSDAIFWGGKYPWHLLFRKRDELVMTSPEAGMGELRSSRTEVRPNIMTTVAQRSTLKINSVGECVYRFGSAALPLWPEVIDKHRPYVKGLALSKWA